MSTVHSNCSSQATGYNCIIAYSLTIFHESGQSLNDGIIMGVKGTSIVVSAIIALALAKICPRKKLLLTSSAGISLSLICLGTYYYFLAFLGVSEKYVFMPLLLLVILILFFMIGFGALAWTIMSEIIPVQVMNSTQLKAYWMQNQSALMIFSYSYHMISHIPKSKRIASNINICCHLGKI